MILKYQDHKSIACGYCGGLSCDNLLSVKNLRHGVVAANISDESLPLWTQFRAMAKGFGLKYTTALEQAARLWIAANSAPDGSPARHNPFQPPPFVDPAPIPDESDCDD